MAEGIWEGRILPAGRGTNGFGYDPLFLDPESGVSSAELPPEAKNARSHRGRALAKMRGLLAARGAGGPQILCTRPEKP